eukprot:6191931-Pleurochrysis_carterae.AAC.1
MAVSTLRPPLSWRNGTATDHAQMKPCGAGSSRLVYFSNLGFYGAVISAAQSALLERHALASAWQANARVHAHAHALTIGHCQMCTSDRGTCMQMYSVP